MMKEEMIKCKGTIRDQNEELLALRGKVELYEGSNEIVQRISSVDKCTELIILFQKQLQRFLSHREGLLKSNCDAQIACAVCRDRPKTILLHPCRHLCLCHQCFTNHKPIKCPICRNDVHDHTQVFL